MVGGETTFLLFIDTTILCSPRVPISIFIHLLLPYVSSVFLYYHRHFLLLVAAYVTRRVVGLALNLRRLRYFLFFFLFFFTRHYRGQGRRRVILPVQIGVKFIFRLNDDGK